MNIWHKLHEIFYEFELFKIQEVGITLNHLLVALISVLGAIFISRMVRKILKKRVFRRMNIDVGLEYTLLRILHFLILGIGIYVGLASINIPMGAVLGLFAVLGVGIGFGFQNVAANFISGVILLLERPIKISDRIEINGLWGDVQQISLRTTVVRTPDNIAIIVPNSNLLNNNLTNYSYGESSIRLRIPVGVAYGSDIPKVLEVLEAAGKSHKETMQDPAPAVWFKEFADSSLNFELLVWIKNPERKYWVTSDINKEIDARFRKENIVIPFPQHDLHICNPDTPLVPASQSKVKEQAKQGS